MKLTKQQFIEKVMTLKHPSNRRQYNSAVTDITSIIQDTEIIPDPEPVSLGNGGTGKTGCVDLELEEVKKRWPIGKEYRVKKPGYPHVCKVVKVERDDDDGCIYIDGWLASSIEPVPEVDTELEEAKKRFPVGSWFTHNKRASTLYKVKAVKYDEKYKRTYILDDAGVTANIYNCTPATLPTRKIQWRCMKTDAPDTTRNVFIKLAGYYCQAWFDESRGWIVQGFHIDLSKYDTALWCELLEIERE